MNIVLILHYYFPYGGAQRDCRRMAEMLAVRGHRVRILTRKWDGDLPGEGVEVVQVGQQGWTNLARDVHFEQDVVRWLSSVGPVDCVVGFLRLSLDMDFYYAADPCYFAKIKRQKPTWYRFTSCYRFKAKAERHLYSMGGRVKILLLTDMEVPIYKDQYGTEDERMLVLPPSIRRRNLDIHNKEELRAEKREEMSWGRYEKVVLFVGSGFATKGLDRAIRAVAELDENMACRFVIVGAGKAIKYERLAKALGSSNGIEFLGARDDAWELMAAADLLLHPARSENTGTVLVEALSAGTGVLTTDRCGFATHVASSGAGLVCASPFSHAKLVDALRVQLEGDWQERAAKALAYAQEQELYVGLETAVGYVEGFVDERAAEGG